MIYRFFLVWCFSPRQYLLAYCFSPMSFLHLLCKLKKTNGCCLLSTESYSSFSFLTSKSVQDEAVKQKETLANEVGCLRADLQKMRDERDQQLYQVQVLNAELQKCKECTGKSVAELENMSVRANELEVRLVVFICLNISKQYLFVVNSHIS